MAGGRQGSNDAQDSGVGGFVASVVGDLIDAAVDAGSSRDDVSA